jgi:Zn-dependent alcohol dehydrogenase
MIIGIDPIRYRRELALKLGATVVLDPNEYKGNELVAKIQQLAADVAPPGRRYVGEYPAGVQTAIECSALANYPLAAGIEAPPDVDIYQQIFASVRSGGSIVMAGQSRTSNGGLFGQKVIFGGNFPGINVLHDLPRYARAVERGQLDLKSITGKTYSLDQSTDAMMAAANRSVITSVIESG